MEVIRRIFDWGVGVLLTIWLIEFITISAIKAWRNIQDVIHNRDEAKE